MQLYLYKSKKLSIFTYEDKFHDCTFIIIKLRNLLFQRSNLLKVNIHKDSDNNL